jgi:hypothetical protein
VLVTAWWYENDGRPEAFRVVEGFGETTHAAGRKIGALRAGLPDTFAAALPRLLDVIS